jgi:hypothetical protein
LSPFTSPPFIAYFSMVLSLELRVLSSTLPSWPFVSDEILSSLQSQNKPSSESLLRPVRNKPFLL